MKNLYYLNTKLIQRVMQEKNLTVKLLAEISGFSVRRLQGYVSGKRVQHIPLDIALFFRTALGIKFEDMLTEKEILRQASE